MPFILSTVWNCVYVICPMICLESSSVIVHILFRGISASFVLWMLADKSFASANLKYTTTEYKQQGIIRDLILVDRKLLHLAWKRLTANPSGIRKEEASLLVLSLCYWSSIRAPWAELVPQATDRMTVFFFVSSEAKNFSWSHSLCKEHAKHCLSSEKMNGYNCVDFDLSSRAEWESEQDPVTADALNLQRWLTSSFMHTNILSNLKFYTEILLPYYSQMSFVI